MRDSYILLVLYFFPLFNVDPRYIMRIRDRRPSGRPNGLLTWIYFLVVKSFFAGRSGFLHFHHSYLVLTDSFFSGYCMYHSFFVGFLVCGWLKKIHVALKLWQVTATGMSA